MFAIRQGEVMITDVCNPIMQDGGRKRGNYRGWKPKAMIQREESDSGSRGPLNYFLMPARRVFSKVRWDTMPRDMPRAKGLRIEEDGLLGAAASSSCGEAL